MGRHNEPQKGSQLYEIILTKADTKTQTPNLPAYAFKGKIYLGQHLQVEHLSGFSSLENYPSLFCIGSWVVHKF